MGHEKEQEVRAWEGLSKCTQMLKALASPAHHRPTNPLSHIWISANPNTLPMPYNCAPLVAHICYWICRLEGGGLGLKAVILQYALPKLTKPFCTQSFELKCSIFSRHIFHHFFIGECFPEIEHQR